MPSSSASLPCPAAGKSSHTLARSQFQQNSIRNATMSPCSTVRISLIPSTPVPTAHQQANPPVRVTYFTSRTLSRPILHSRPDSATKHSKVMTQPVKSNQDTQNRRGRWPAHRPSRSDIHHRRLVSASQPESADASPAVSER